MTKKQRALVTGLQASGVRATPAHLPVSTGIMG